MVILSVLPRLSSSSIWVSPEPNPFLSFTILEGSGGLGFRGVVFHLEDDILVTSVLVSFIALLTVSNITRSTRVFLYQNLKNVNQNQY